MFPTSRGSTSKGRRREGIADPDVEKLPLPNLTSTEIQKNGSRKAFKNLVSHPIFDCESMNGPSFCDARPTRDARSPSVRHENLSGPRYLLQLEYCTRVEEDVE
jgi:hypothetical protein